MSLNKKGFVRILTRHPTAIEELRNRIPTEEFIIYRHGSISLITGNKYKEINRISGILNCSDKLRMKYLIGPEYGPEYFFFEHDVWWDGRGNEYTREELMDHITFPTLSKLQFRSGGKGMQLHPRHSDLSEVLNEAESRYVEGKNQKYLERYHNYSLEYRLHCSTLGPFYACRKARLKDVYTYYRNDSNSVWFTQFDDESKLKDDFKQPHSWSEIEQACMGCLSKLNLDIGAFDIIVSKEGKFKILECNSAPGMGKISGEKYRREIAKLIKYVQ